MHTYPVSNNRTAVSYIDLQYALTEDCILDLNALHTTDLPFVQIFDNEISAHLTVCEKEHKPWAFPLHGVTDPAYSSIHHFCIFSEGELLIQDGIHYKPLATILSTATDAAKNHIICNLALQAASAQLHLSECESA